MFLIICRHNLHFYKNGKSRNIRNISKLLCFWNPNTSFKRFLIFMFQFKEIFSSPTFPSLNLSNHTITYKHTHTSGLTCLVSDKHAACSGMPSNQKSVHVCLFSNELLTSQLEVKLWSQQPCSELKTPGDGCSSIQTSSRSCWHLVKRTKRQTWMLGKDNETQNTAVKSYVIVACSSANCHFWHPGHFTLQDTFARRII